MGVTIYERLWEEHNIDNHSCSQFTLSDRKLVTFSYKTNGLFEEGTVQCFRKSDNENATIEYHTFEPDLKYHSSWDWLHPAWDKFRDLSFRGNIKNIFTHSIYRDRISKAISWGGTVTDAFKELVEAIKWYNSQTSPDRG